MVEKELKTLLETINGLENKVFMLNAPKTEKSPYLIYSMNNSEEQYTLDGTTGNRYIPFDLNLFSKDDGELKTIQYEIRSKLLSLQGTNLGAFYIQKAKVRMTDIYDSAVELYRTVIELEIYI